MNYKKNIIGGLVALSMLISSTSCDDYLEEPLFGFREQVGRLDPSSLNVEQLESRLQGLIRGLGDDRMFNDNGYRTYWGDTSVDIFSLPFFARDKALETYTQLPTSNLFDEVWTQQYFYISQASEIINDLGPAALALEDETPTATKLKELVGTAYFIRAMLYFNLVKVFESPTIASTETPTEVKDILAIESTGNATPKEVYDIIISDLKVVSGLVEDTNNYQTVTKMAAEGLLGRVYIQIAGILNHDFVVDKSIYNFDESAADFYALALEQFEKVILSGKYSLQSNYGDIFDPEKEGPGKNTESIYSVPFAKTGDGGGSNFGDGYGILGGPPNAAFLERQQMYDYLYSYFDDVDKIPAAAGGATPFPLNISDSRFLRNIAPFRLNTFNNTGNFEDVQKNIFSGDWGIYKLTKPIPAAPTEQGDYDVDFPYLRYADILLMKAEALLKTNGSVSEARELINMVRRRAYRFDPLDKDRNTDEIALNSDGTANIEGLNMNDNFHNSDNLDAFLSGTSFQTADMPTIVPGRVIITQQRGYEAYATDPMRTNRGLWVDLPETLDDATGVFEALMRERRKEFAGEGLRKDTLIRNGILDEVVLGLGNGVMSPFSAIHDKSYTGATSNRSQNRKASDGYANFKYRWPISQAQIDLDEELKQNSGY